MRIRAVMLAAALIAGCSPTAVFERSVPLEGQSNFRDIGGYETVDGRKVKTGVLYRSGELHALSDADVEKLHDLGITTVASFLIPQEIEARGADRVPEGTQEIHLPIEAGGGLVMEVSEARKTGDFSKVPADLNPQFHELLAEQATEEYAALIRAILAAEGEPVAYHCSHGIHRTGTATAIVLSALGVPWMTVRADYMLSNQTRADEIELRTEQLRQLAAQTFDVPPEQVDMTNINAFYILEPKYIDGTMRYISEHYGDIDAYLTKGLGLSNEEVEQLRALMLEE